MEGVAVAEVEETPVGFTVILAIYYVPTGTIMPGELEMVTVPSPVVPKIGPGVLTGTM